MYFLLILCMLLFLLIIYIAFLQLKSKSKDNFDQVKTVDIVVARYNESLDWLYTDFSTYINNPKVKTTIFIYNKGADIIANSITNTNTNIINLPNVGREAHTHLYHIINNYDNLADVTIFLTGSANMDHKIGNTSIIIQKSYQDLDSTFVCQKTDLQSLYNFSIDEWKSSNNLNAGKNMGDELQPCDPRPFGKWYEQIFNESNTPISALCYYGIFSVSKNNIHNRSLSFYENLIKYVDSHHNTEAGHYFERAWIAIFHPIEINRLFLST